MSNQLKDGFIQIRGARQNNLQGINLDIPRGSLVAFTGVSGSGKSSIAFGTIYAEAQRRYFESIAPYARRLIAQLPSPRVSDIAGLPPAVALQQRRGEPTSRSSVGTLTTLSNLLRMLYSRAGNYPDGVARLDSDAFSPNTPEGACSSCHGIGVVHTVSENSLVPDPSLSIRAGAIAAWPGAWQGKNYRDILSTLGYDIDKPWRDLSQSDRDWILFTEEKPVVTVHAVREAHRIQRPYQGTYMSAASYVRHTFANTNSPTLRKRVLKFMNSASCSACQGKRLRAQSLAVKFADCDIAEMGQMSIDELTRLFTGYSKTNEKAVSTAQAETAAVLIKDFLDRSKLLSSIGLGYLSLDRTVPTLSAGELQRLRLATQLRSGLFGVVYVLDEPSAGLHPADSEALLNMLGKLKDSGNSVLLVEHEMDIVRHCDWVVDIGPGAGDGGGSLLYSGPVGGLAQVEESVTRNYLFPTMQARTSAASARQATGWMRLSGASMHNLKDVDVDFPLGLLTVVTGVSGSGKSTLVSQVLAETLGEKLRADAACAEATEENVDEEADEDPDEVNVSAASIDGIENLARLVRVDQKPIGRTPRSNLATYTGLFDHIRKLYAATADAKSRGYKAGRFSFNVAGGRCETCEGEGFVSIELLFLPSVYAPCAACHGSRYNAESLQVQYRNANIAQVLDMTVDAASIFFCDVAAVSRALNTLRDVGLGYLRLGQPATELSGGEAQRIKLATELQREQHGTTVYLLDEPTTGLHPADTEKLMRLLHALADAGNTVIVVEHDMDVVAAADWVIDLGPGAGTAGGTIVAVGTPADVARQRTSVTGKYLREKLDAGSRQASSA